MEILRFYWFQMKLALSLVVTLAGLALHSIQHLFSRASSFATSSVSPPSTLSTASPNGQKSPLSPLFFVNALLTLAAGVLWAAWFWIPQPIPEKTLPPLPIDLSALREQSAAEIPREELFAPSLSDLQTPSESNALAESTLPQSQNSPDTITTLFLTKEEAASLLQQHETFSENYRFLPQTYYVNTALLAYIAQDYEKTGRSFLTARFIYPNAWFFTE